MAPSEARVYPVEAQHSAKRYSRSPCRLAKMLRIATIALQRGDDARAELLVDRIVCDYQVPVLVRFGEQGRVLEI
jgi:hypothetical protein